MIGIIPSMHNGNATIIAIVAWLGNTTLNPYTHFITQIHYTLNIILLVLNAINHKNYTSVCKCKTIFFTKTIYAQDIKCN
jgi:hypothetical protein